MKTRFAMEKRVVFLLTVSVDAAKGSFFTHAAVWEKLNLRYGREFQANTVEKLLLATSCIERACEGLLDTKQGL